MAEKITIGGDEYFINTTQREESSRRFNMCSFFIGGKHGCYEMSKESATACFMGSTYMDLRSKDIYVSERVDGYCPIIQGEN